MNDEEDLAPTIEEEEALPSKEELEDLVARAENPVCNNDMTHQAVDDNINSDLTAGNPGSFALISDENIDQMMVRELQDRMRKQ
eukprot:5280364-Ditylum_brightwellii.AAC.1